MNPLDEEVPVETFEAVREAFKQAEERLIFKYRLPRKGFLKELRRRIAAEEILDEPDVTRWQTLYDAMLDWAREEPRETVQTPPPQTIETCYAGAASGSPFFWAAPP